MNSDNVQTSIDSDNVQMSVDTQKDGFTVSRKAEESSESKTGNSNEDPERESGSEKTAPENTKQSVPSIKTLADLIRVCRDRGLQIYNDKKNIPDSDRLKVLPAHLTDPKVHRSDGYDVVRRGGSVNSRRSRHLSQHKQSDSLESPGRIRRSHSRRTTQSYKSSSDWRTKSPTTSTLSQGQSEFSVTTERSSGQQTLHEKVSIDYPNVDGDIETEKILRMRMRKRVRRHRETVTNLVDVIKMKQKELELIENKLKFIQSEEGGQLNDENQGEESVGAKPDVHGDWNSSNIDSGIESDKIKSETSSTSDLKGKDVGLNENVAPLKHDKDERINSQTNNENKYHVSAESFENIAENLSDKVNDTNDNTETTENQGESAVNNPNTSNGEVNKPTVPNGEANDTNVQNGEDTEIEEYVIQDGNTKLVLYRLKTSTALLENIENKNSHKNENQIINNEEEETGNKDSNDERNTGDTEPCSYNNDQLKDPLKGSETLSQPQNQSKTVDFKLRGASDYVVTPLISNDKDNNSQGTSRTNNDINNSSSTNGAVRAHSLSTDEQRENTQLQTSSKSDGTNSGHKHYSDENCNRNFDVSEKQAMTIQENTSADNEGDRSLNAAANKASIDSQSKLSDIKPKLNSDNCIGNNGESNVKGNIEVDTMATQESCLQKHGVEGLEKVGTNNGSNTEGQNMEILNDKLENSADKTNSKGVHSGTNNKTIQASLDRNDGKAGQKKPKRSLGNGFLVSGDDDDGCTIRTKDKEINKTEQDMEKDIQCNKPGQKVVSQRSSQPSTSGRGSKTSVKSFSSAAKQVLIATRIRQSFNEEKSQQANYVKEIGDTRKALRELYRKLRSGEDEQADSKMDEEIVKPAESEVVEKCENVQETVDEKFAEEVKSKTNVKEEENDSKEQQMPIEKDVSANDEEEKVIDEVQSEKSTSSKVEVQSNDDSSLQSNPKTKLYCVAKKVDNEWNPNHPLYDQIKDGFKSNFRIHDTKKVNIALRGLRADQFDISHVSDDNVYLKEARRIYPQGFQSSEHKSKKASDLQSNGVRVENTLTKQRDPQKRFSPDRLVKEKTVYGGKDSQKSIEDKRVRIHKTRTLKSLPKAENKQDISTPRKKAIPRFKPKKRSNIVDVEEDKLSKDRNTVELYQQYLNNNANLPTVNGPRRKNNVKVTPVKSRDSKQNSTAIPQAKFSSYKDRNNTSEDDNAPDGLEESESETLVSRETMRDRLARRASERSISSEQRPEDVPLSKAVEIVKSRQKFYNENGEIQTREREHRVFKLFRQIQMIRKGADNSVDYSTITDYPVVDSSPFLMMDYDYSQSAISTHRTDTELQKFLSSSLDYNMCLKSRSLYSYPRRHDKAWNELKQKLDHSLMFSNNLK